MSDSGAGDEVDVAGRLTEGYQTFLGVTIQCGHGVLVPRPETELLAQVALGAVQAAGSGARVIDMCCGAGNLACVLGVHAPDARVWASDLTDSCVQQTRDNVARLGLGDRVQISQGDLFAGLEGQGLEGTIDVLVCNPPYISTKRLDEDRASLLDHEPREAFDGGPYGLSIHQRVIREAPAYLKPGAWLFVEVGLGQDRQVKLLFDRTRAYESPQFFSPDQPASQPRVVGAKRLA